MSDIEFCPECRSELNRAEVDVGLGVLYGPWGCHCGWSEDDRYNLLGSPIEVPGFVVDQYGGLTRKI